MQNDVCRMETKDDNNGNHPDNVDTSWYYFDIPNNGEIPEDELNYQTNNINSIETTSTIKWKTDKDYNNEFSHNNNHNQDDGNNYDDHYGVHSESINSNPSMIPNDGERIQLFSLVSRGMILSLISDVKKEEIKNKEVKKQEVKNVYHYSNNYDEVYANITSATKLEYLEWIRKKYQVNSNNIDDTELE